MNLNFIRKNLLGSGAYGSVYKTNFENKEYAVKKYLGTKNGAWNQTALRELVCMTIVPRHPSLMKLEFARQSEQGTLLFFPKLISSLYFHLKHTLSGHASKEDVLKWSCQIMKGISHMHSHGFIHRDIKLENILIDASGNAIIGDFGMARFLSKDCHPPLSKEVCSLWTRPPELFIDTNILYDDRIDSWSLGCVMLALAAGKYVFRSTSTEGTIMPSIYSLLGIGETKKAGYLKKTVQEQLKSLKSASGRTDLPDYFYETILSLLNIDFNTRSRVIDVSNKYSTLFYDFDETVKEDLFVLNVSKCFTPKTSEFTSNKSSHKLLIASWIWDTCATLRLHVTTSFFALFCWLKYSPNFSETICAAACCSLVCKLNEVRCFSPSTWSKTVNCSVNELISAENEIVFLSRGHLLPYFTMENLQEIAAAFLFLASTDLDLKEIYEISKNFKDSENWQKYRLNLPKITKFAEK